MAESSYTYKGRMPISELDSNEDRYGKKIVNIAEDYDWTLAPKGEARRNVPIMRLTQFELNANSLLSNLKFWARGIKERDADPYKGLYRAKSTGVEFTFPWFESYHHQLTQNWEDYKGLESTKLGQDLIAGFSVLTNSPGVAINTPKVWKGASRATVPYSITLFNTTGANSADSLSQNRQLINRLIASTLHDQQNQVLAGPPTLYELDIPGVRYSPACVINNIVVENVGTFIRNAKGKENLIPEAFKVSFQITELISESRQIYDGAAGGSKVKSIIPFDAPQTNETPPEVIGPPAPPPA